MEPTRETQVMSQMALLKEQIEELEKVAIALRERLFPILRKDTLDANAEKDEVSKTLVPLAEDIMVLKNRVNCATVDIGTLLQELEL